MAEHRFPFNWKLVDGYPSEGIEPNGMKVFGTFVCGGGSSMGYKLAGYDHLGGVELDPKVCEIYERNHHPKYLFAEDLREFNRRDDLPEELYHLDVLDGSPPCSTFSMAGSREKAWGKKKKFAEGQKMQTLDDLVFVYCETIGKLQPKVYILENVKGLAQGNAQSYLKRICSRMDGYGYTQQVFVLNAASMGVPQRRERTFIIGHRKDLDYPRLTLDFHESPVLFKECMDRSDTSEDITPMERSLWNERKVNDTKLSDISMRVRGKNSGFTRTIWHRDAVAPTLTTTEPILYDYPRNPTSRSWRQWARSPRTTMRQGTGCCG